MNSEEFEKLTPEQRTDRKASNLKDISEKEASAKSMAKATHQKNLSDKYAKERESHQSELAKKNEKSTVVKKREPKMVHFGQKKSNDYNTTARQASNEHLSNLKKIYKAGQGPYPHRQESIYKNYHASMEEGE